MSGFEEITPKHFDLAVKDCKLPAGFCACEDKCPYGGYPTVNTEDCPGNVSVVDVDDWSSMTLEDAIKNCTIFHSSPKTGASDGMK